MTRRRTAAAWTFAGVAGLVLLAAPAAAAGYDSTTEALIRGLNRKLLLAAVPVTLIVQGLLIYATIRFHYNDEPKPTRENRKLELAMVAAIAIILLFVGVSSYVVLAQPAVSDTPDEYGTPANAVEVRVVGQQWYWDVTYPGQNVTVRNEIVVPEGRPIVFTLTSDDVIHSMHVPELGLKQDAIPGTRTVLRTTPTEQGTYRMYCAEYCGAGHSKMNAQIRVVSNEEYRQWLDRNEGTGRSTAAGGGNETATAGGTTGEATETAATGA